jgi:hypothetical protein
LLLAFLWAFILFGKHATLVFACYWLCLAAASRQHFEKNPGLKVHVAFVIAAFSLPSPDLLNLGQQLAQ